MKLRGVQLPGPLLTIVVVMTMSLSAIAQQPAFNKYHTPSEISGYVNAFAKSNFSRFPPSDGWNISFWYPEKEC